MIVLLLEHKSDPSTPYGVNIGDGRQLVTCAADDEVAETIAAQAAGFAVVFVGPVSEADAFLQSAMASTEPYRLWHYLSGPRPVSPSLVDYTSAAQMREALVPSVDLDLRCRILGIDWLEPGAVPADLFGERFTGTNVVVRETRQWVEGERGPVARLTTPVAIREDGTDGESWTRRKAYPGRLQTQRGDQRRQEAVSRAATWATVAAGMLLQDEEAGVLAVTQWAATIGTARETFERLAITAPLVDAIRVSSEPWWSVSASSLGLTSLIGLDGAADVRACALRVFEGW